MPEHCLHAIFGKLVVDPIMPPMLQQLLQRHLAVKIFEERKQHQKLMLGNIGEVALIGIQHMAVTFENAHHL